MKDYVSILNPIIFGLIELGIFYKIIKYKRYDTLSIVLSTISFIIGCVISNMEQIGPVLGNLWLLGTFYFIYNKYKISVLIFGVLFFIFDVELAVELIAELIEFIFSKDLDARLLNLIIFLILVLPIILVKRYSDKLHKLLTNQNNRAVLFVLLYVYVSISAWVFITISFGSWVAQYLFLIGLFISQIIFLIFAYYEITRIQKKLLEKQKQKEILDKQKQLEEYTKYLENSEDDLRQFRHDYRNVLNSLKISAQEGNVQEVIRKLDKYTKSNLNPKALLKYKDVNHVHVKSIKSIIITKLSEMYNLKIPYNFECRSSVRELPDNIDELDLVRILGIVFDNAIEESKIIKDMAKKDKFPEYEEIQIMAYSDGPDNFEFEIRNRVREDQKISTSKIQEKGFTTKKDHKGYGLANIRELEGKYPDMSVSYMVQDGWFDFYMTIDTEDGDEDDG